MSPAVRRKTTPPGQRPSVTIGGGPNGNTSNIYIKYHQLMLQRARTSATLSSIGRTELTPQVRLVVKSGFGKTDPRVLADKLVLKRVLAEFGIGEEVRGLLPQEGLVDTFIIYRLHEVLAALSLPSNAARPFIEILNKPFGSFSYPGLDKMVQERFKESHNLWTKLAKAGLTLGEALLTLQFVEAYRVAKEQGWI